MSIICIICNLRFVWGFLSVSFLFFPISVSPSAGATQMRAVPLLSTVTDAFYLVGFFSSGVILATCRHPLRQDSKKRKDFSHIGIFCGNLTFTSLISRFSVKLTTC